MTIVVQTPPSEEPITVAEAKVQCKIHSSITVYDDEIERIIKAVRQSAEVELHRYLITQTLDAYFDRFPSQFKLPPLQSVESITYLDDSGDTQTLASDQYVVDAVSQPARITPAYSVTWPTIRDQVNSVKVRFVAGYGDASEVPECIKQWMLLKVLDHFDNKGSFIVGTSAAEMPRTFVDSLLDPERVMERV